jgi:hypothetical protein
MLYSKNVGHGIAFLLYEWHPYIHGGGVDTVWSRVARWYFFKPKIPIWVNLGGP